MITEPLATKKLTSISEAKMNKIITAIVLVGLALLIGCNTFLSKDKTEIAPQYLSEISITEGEWHMTPSDLYAKAGDVKFILTNDGNRRHEFQIGEDVEHKVLVNAGTTVEAMFNLAPGEYKVLCPINGHEEAGMVATLHVA